MKKLIANTNDVGDIWNAQVRISKKQTSGTVNVLADSSRVPPSSNRRSARYCIGEPLTFLTEEENAEAISTKWWSESVETIRNAPTVGEDIVRSSQKCEANKTPINIGKVPQFLGVISVRVDLSSMDAPDPANLFYGLINDPVRVKLHYMLETRKVVSTTIVVKMKQMRGACSLKSAISRQPASAESPQRLHVKTASRPYDIVRSASKVAVNNNGIFFEAIGVAQLVTIGSAEIAVTGQFSA